MRHRHFLNHLRSQRDFGDACFDERHFQHGHFHRHGPRGPFGRHGRHRGGVDDGEHLLKRLLGHGDLRMVVLYFIEEKPRHGYELIKLIEAKSHGQYSPSPGVIYPTLTYLEDTGLVKTKELDEKKQYSITADGTAFLKENRENAEAILQRLEDIGKRRAAFEAESQGEPFTREDRSEIKNVFHALKAELRSSRFSNNKKEILQILKRALSEIQKL